MGAPAIRAENVGKKYRVVQGDSRGSYRTFRELLTDAAGAPVRWVRGSAERAAAEEFWALNGVSFEVAPGEVVGIVGRNGAGKSTLLKVLSRITRPTTGRVEIRGRVGSLLEVGTGFHPELTGRENVYLNGSILGMSRKEIDRKFDEIVAFSEVEKFLETPVKRYSSGMYVRLAFAVAAHLEPEILIIDEVLAVGDAAFQDKCIAKIQSAGRSGRTVFFVSHSLPTVRRLTSHCLYLNRGQVVRYGPTREVVGEYEAGSAHGAERGRAYEAPPTGGGPNRVKWAKVLTSEPDGVHDCGKPLTVEVGLEVREPRETLMYSFQVVNADGQPVCHFARLERDQPYHRGPGVYVLRLRVPRARLYLGRYRLVSWLSERRPERMIEHLPDICRFDVQMLSLSRPEYEYRPGDMVYVEDAAWDPVEAAR